MQSAEIRSTAQIAPTPEEEPTGTRLLTNLCNTWSEYLSIAAAAGLAGAIYFTPIYYFRHRVIPLTPALSFNGTKTLEALHAPVDLTYPMEQEPLDCALVVVFGPLLVVVLFWFKLRDFWDLHAGGLGTFKAVISTTLVSVILKQFIGGFRPYYMVVCKPDMNMLYRDSFQHRYWFNATACTGTRHDVEKALQTFPSGHTANTFASAIFLTLYLNAKLKVFVDHSSNIGVLILVILPLIGAAIISGTMYTSHQHHAYDIVWGMIIGLALGILAYRTAYTAVLDFRYNHIPLSPMPYRGSVSEASGLVCKNRSREDLHKV